MSVFIIMLAVGLIGMILMILPGLKGHSHLAHSGHTGHAGAAHAASSTHGSHITAAPMRMLRSFSHFTQPRVIFSVLALYGAFGLALCWLRISVGAAALIAILPALLVEKYLLTTVWNTLIQFQGPPASPLSTVTLADATALTEFRNGRGMVQFVHDGRTVQFMGYLEKTQESVPIQVGERLRIEEVDGPHERVIVSIR